MIQKTGVIGVHFGQYIRYAGIGRIDKQKEKIKRSFGEAKVEY